VSTLIEAAREYRARNLAVIPVGRDKHPLIEWKRYQNELPHPDQVDEWWFKFPTANVGTVTGKISGLVVLDADGPLGLASLKALGTPATTWVSRTGRLEGGWQQFFRHPGGMTIGNRAGLRPGLDVRGDGGYVILPPSRHTSGRCYEWLTAPEVTELAAISDTLLRLLLAPDPIAASSVGGMISEGRRNDSLYRLGRSMLAKGLSTESVTIALLEENRRRCRPPLTDREVRAIVAHAALQPHRSDFAPGARTAGQDDGLALVSVGDLLGESDSRTRWVVDQRLPAEGLGLLAGKPKAGKSTLARCLALHVSRGGRWLGFSTTPGGVIYLALEEKRQEVKDHFRALGATRADSIYLRFAAVSQDALARLRVEAERRRPVLVIIDPLFKFVRVPAELGNDYAAMSALLEHSSPSRVRPAPMSSPSTTSERASEGTAMPSSDRRPSSPPSTPR
jgi:hypothetical protein